jgi:carnitine O-palmitoyltransferase 1, liver isoform
MAEAHQAIGVFDEHKRGVELLYSDQGLRISFTIPPPWRLRQSIVRSFYHMERAVKNRVYPAPPMVAVFMVVAVIGIVLVSPSDSWWRNSWLAHVVWHIGNFLIPFSSFIPPTLYLAYLTAWAAFIGLLLLMAAQRLVLRGLLSYRRWLYLGPREKSKTVLVWGALLKLLGGTNPLTYSFQDALPRLPVPPLKDTVTRLLRSVHPLMSEAEYQEMEKMAADFLKKDGPKLQWYLYLKSWWSPNYVTDWWEKYVYLKGRTSLMINSNYYGLPARNLEYLPSTNQAAVAAVFIRHFMLFKQDLDREKLPPMLIRGIVPLCMSQYQRMFGCTRIPGREEDELKLFQSKHVAVQYKGRFYKMPLFEKGERGKLLSFHEMQRQIEGIMAMGDSLGEPTAGEKHLPALTAVGRIEWAENREKYFSEGVNKRSLNVIESAVFVVTLQDNTVQDWSSMGRDLIHGNGSNRWFDKSFNLVIYKNGITGFNAEHSWADAPAMAHSWEWVVTKQTIADPYLPDGNTKCVSEKEKTSTLPT